MSLPQPPAGPIRAVLSWVDTDPARATTALQVEELRERPRKGIVEPLRQLLAAAEKADPTIGQLKAKLGRGLLEDAIRLRDQMFSPVIEHKAMIIAKGDLTGKSDDVVVVDIERDEPTFSEKRIIAQTITLATEQAVALIGDEATESGGVLHDLAAERAARRSAAAQAAAASGGSR